MLVVAFALVIVGALLLVGRRRGRRGAAPASWMLRALACDAAPEDAEWATAMLHEHDAIDDGPDRDRFARGAILALARTPNLRGAARRVDVAIDGVCIVAAASLAAACLVRYPGLRVGTAWMVYCGLFVLGLACYAIAALAFSRFGTRQDHLVGAAVGVSAIAFAWAATTTSTWSVLLPTTVVLLPALAAVVDPVVRRGDATPWVAGASCAVTAGLSFFVGFVAATVATSGGAPTPTLLAEALRSNVRPYAAWAVGDALGGACFMLVLVLVAGGLLGIGSGALLARRRTSH